MDKRVVENQRVRKAAVSALIKLMKKNRFSEITVTDIVKESGIARQSYYRNFTCKEDLIIEFMLEVQRGTLMQLKAKEISSFNPEFLKTVLDGLKPYREEVIAIYNAGLSILILQSINEVCEQYFGDMPFDSVSRYKLYCLAGMIFNVEMKWLQEGALEATEDIADIVFSFSTKELFEMGNKRF